MLGLEEFAVQIMALFMVVITLVMLLLKYQICVMQMPLLEELVE